MLGKLLFVVLFMGVCESTLSLPQSDKRNISWTNLDGDNAKAIDVMAKETKNQDDFNSSKTMFSSGVREQATINRIKVLAKDRPAFLKPQAGSERSSKELFIVTSSSLEAVSVPPVPPGNVDDGEAHLDGEGERMKRAEKTTAVEVTKRSQSDAPSIGLLRKDRGLSSTHDYCYVSFDAAANIRSELFFIRRNVFWRFNTHGVLIDRKATPMSSFWTDFPNVTVDAAFASPANEHIVFISGNEYWVYFDNNSKDPRSPRSICDFGVCNGEKVYGAVVWKANKQVYIFGKNVFWKLDDNLKVEIGYPKNISGLRGVPRALDAAVEDVDGHTYFLKGQRCWRLDDDILAASKQYTEYIGFRWFGCNNSEYEVYTTAVTATSNSNRTKSTLHNRILLVLISLVTSHSLCWSYNFFGASVLAV